MKQNRKPAASENVRLVSPCQIDFYEGRCNARREFDYRLNFIVSGDCIVMEKVSQRTGDDCVICVLAMVMGPPYTYERVVQDSKKYRKTDDQGRFVAWFARYLQDEGFEVEDTPMSDLRRFSDLASLPEGSRAMLVFHMPHLKINHIVAIDQYGVIDPRDDPPEYKSVDNFREIFGIERWQLPHPNFWLVRKRNAV